MNKGPAFKITLTEVRVLKKVVVVTHAGNKEDALRKARAGVIDSVLEEKVISVRRKPTLLEVYERVHS